MAYEKCVLFKINNVDITDYYECYHCSEKYENKRNREKDIVISLLFYEKNKEIVLKALTGDSDILTIQWHKTFSPEYYNGSFTYLGENKSFIEEVPLRYEWQFVGKRINDIKECEEK